MLPIPAPFPRYQCPGETREISRSVHLGRLAAFYPACRNCACRVDTGSLPPSHLEQLEELFRAAPNASLLFDEGLVGVEATDIHPTLIRRAATAFAHTLSAENANRVPSGPVLIGCDGRPTTSELIAAAADGLRLSQINVIEIGPTTGGCFAHALQALNAAGGMLLGCARGRRREVSLKFWTQQGIPLSAGEELTCLEQRLLANPTRTARHGGTLTRAESEADYLAALAPSFHGLRPLGVRIDCGSEPWWRHLHLLSGQVACEFVPWRAGPQALDSPVPKLDVEPAHASFSLWVDGDGEACRFWDEQGQPVCTNELILLLATRLLREQGACTMIVPESFPTKARRQLARAGVRIETAIGDSRRAMHQSLVQTGATFGGDPHGRYWFASPGPQPDALRTLATLLNFLSESDAPFSQRLAEL